MANVKSVVNVILNNGVGCSDIEDIIDFLDEATQKDIDELKEQLTEVMLDIKAT